MRMGQWSRPQKFFFEFRCQIYNLWCTHPVQFSCSFNASNIPDVGLFTDFLLAKVEATEGAMAIPGPSLNLSAPVNLV